MAYVFDNIDSAMNGQQGADTATPGQSNIFQGQEVSNATPSSSAPTSSGAADVKTSTDADLNNTPASSSAGPTTTGSQPRESAGTQNTSAAIQKNNTQSFSGLPQSYTDSVSNINQGLQDEANSYVSTEGAKGSTDNLSSDSLNNLQSDGTARAAAAARLAETAPTVNDYASQHTANTAIANLNDLNSQAGLSNVVSQNANENYTGGLANVDAMLLGQNKDFIAARQGINQQQAAFNQQVTDNETNLTAKAQAAATGNFNAGTDAIKSSIGSQQAAITAAAVKRQQAYNAAVAALAAKGDPTQAAAYSKQAMTALNASADSAPWAKYASQAAVDPSKYMTYGSQITDPTQFYTAQDSANYNNLSSLLGGQSITAGKNPTTPSETFNASAYQEAVQAAAQKLAVANTPAAPKKVIEGPGNPNTVAPLKGPISDRGNSYDPGASNADNLLNTLKAVPANTGAVASNTSKATQKGAGDAYTNIDSALTGASGSAGSKVSTGLKKISKKLF